MKIKIDFITNSSSSSYILFKKDLNEQQLFLIRNHIEVAPLVFKKQNYYAEAWDITEDEEQIELSTSMDNFDMNFFLDEIGVDLTKGKYEHS